MRTILNPNVEKLVVNESILDDSIEAEDLFLMANFYQEDTGLPMVIWISEKGHTQHAARIKVSKTHNTKAEPHDTVSVSITDEPEIVAGTGLSNRDLKWVCQFIHLNKATLLAYWHREISTIELCKRLVKLTNS